jgi:ParB family chromosome partitioning protein
MIVRHPTGEVRMIPVDQIEVINPRERNGRVFNEIVVNIRTIGLKKPIKVTPRVTSDGVEKYLLVCGEGRLKAFRSLGEPTIPALVVNISDEDAFIMSLAENIARRRCRPLELLAGIRQMQEHGYTPKAIAEKTGLTQQYVQGILTLLHQGEERLVVAVEKGQIPLNAALTIVGAGDDDAAIQAALQEAYESGKLRGKPLMNARRIIERRKALGRSAGCIMSGKVPDITTSSLIRTYPIRPSGQIASRYFHFVMVFVWMRCEKFERPRSIHRSGGASTAAIRASSRERNFSSPLSYRERSSATLCVDLLASLRDVTCTDRSTTSCIR